MTLPRLRIANVPQTLGAYSLVDSVLVHALPRELLVQNMPLQDLPEDHRAGEHIDLVVVLRMRVPELGRLPIDGADQATDHGTGRLFHLRKTKVGDLGNTPRSNEDVGGLAVAVDDRGLPQM